MGIGSVNVNGHIFTTLKYGYNKMIEAISKLNKTAKESGYVLEIEPITIDIAYTEELVKYRKEIRHMGIRYEYTRRTLQTIDNAFESFSKDYEDYKSKSSIFFDWNDLHFLSNEKTGKRGWRLDIYGKTPCSKQLLDVIENKDNYSNCNPKCPVKDFCQDCTYILKKYAYKTSIAMASK